MKKLVFSLAVLAMAALTTACSNDDTLMETSASTQSGEAASDGTVLIYMAGKNDLSDFLDDDLNEIREGSRRLADNSHLLVFVRRYNGSEQPWLARIRNGEVTDSVSLADMGIKSSDGQNRASDPAVFKGVLHYALSHYPATHENYGLVLWGHASGWLMMKEVTPRCSRAYGSDYGNYVNSQDERCINIPEVAHILEGLPHLRFIMADCCNFMCLENLYELRNVCDYIIGSPAEIPDCGAPYNKIVPDMFGGAWASSPATVADETFYTNIIDKYYKNEGGCLPLTVVRTSGMDNLAQATRQALQAITAAEGTQASSSAGGGYNNGIYPDMTGIIHYYYTDKMVKFHPEYCIFYDAGDFIRTYAPEAVYQQWRQALDRTIVDRRMATRWSTDKIWRIIYTDFTVTEEKFHGVSMFVAQDPARGNYARYNEDIKQMAWHGITTSIED